MPGVLMTAKAMVLVLIAIFGDLHMDADSYVGPVDLDGCRAAGRELSDQWKARDPEIVAFAIKCEEIDNPVVTVHEHLGDVPAPEPTEQKHEAGKDEA